MITASRWQNNQVLTGWLMRSNAARMSFCCLVFGRRMGKAVMFASAGIMSPWPRVNLEEQKIAFSDPFRDATEEGMTDGEIGSGWLMAHTPIPGHTSDIHNDAGNLSHDIYSIEKSVTPGGIWGLGKYYTDEMIALIGANPHPDYGVSKFIEGAPVFVATEFAVVVSPFSWKASGKWNSTGGVWEPIRDYAVSGMPDFSQKQDEWKFPTTHSWSFCGPAAAANALWWFDSKYEPLPQHPPTSNDHYPLVPSYAVPPDTWDDHEPINVDDASSAWPPGNELVERLALSFMTDLGNPGTQVTNLANGLADWITTAGLDYVVETQVFPEFWKVSEAVERSQNVILLLGFYEENSGIYKRLGGHYVTTAGVDQQGGFIALSDPWFDRIEETWPYAGYATVPDALAYFGRREDGHARYPMSLTAWWNRTWFTMMLATSPMIFTTFRPSPVMRVLGAGLLRHLVGRG